VAGEDAIRAEGTIVEVLSQRLFRVELANGHRLLAYVSGKRRLAFERMSLGDRVLVRMSPYDLSKGRITTES